MHISSARAGSHRRFLALITLLVGAGGSFCLMLYAGRGQQSLLLMALFAGWVLAPFAALSWAYAASKDWAAWMQGTLYGVIGFVTLGSLVIYGSLALGMLNAKNGFIFLVVPAGTWLLVAVILALGVRRRSS